MWSHLRMHTRTLRCHRYSDSTYFSRSARLLAHLELSATDARAYLQEEKRSSTQAMAAAGRWLVPAKHVESAVASFDMFRAAAAAGRLTEKRPPAAARRPSAGSARVAGRPSPFLVRACVVAAMARCAALPMPAKH